MTETHRTLSRRTMLASLVTLGSTGFGAGITTQAAFSDSGTESGSWTAGMFGSGRVAYVTSELMTARHESGTSTYGVTDAPVIGPSTDIFDSTYSIPITDGNGNMKLVDDAGNVQSLATGDTSPRTSKSILASGAWNGSGDTVFYTDGSSIHRVAPGDSSPTTVRTTGNGANAMVGIIDIDEDGTDELLYVDGSAVVRYLKPNDSTEYKIGGSGANNQYGVGPPISTDSGPRVPVINGSNAVALMAVDGTKTTLTAGSTAKKTAVAGKDIDDDGTVEVTFVDTNNRLMYADDLTQQTTPKEFYDGSGNLITNVDASVGVLGT